ncbi:MAG: ArnT family glycosyltransferase [Desulfomonilaceae bacterium]
MNPTQHSWGTLFTKEGVVTDLLIIASLWALSVCITNPNGDFPLNDDWQYAATVKHLLDEGKFVLTSFTSPTAIVHALYGTIFCHLFGFSFTALRFSTLILAFVGIWAAYLLFRQLDSNRWFALTAALVLAFNPLYFQLSHTFMTDAPFTALLILSLLFFLRHLLFRTKLDFILGACFSTAAILTRQIGLVIPIAYCLTMLLKRRNHAFLATGFLTMFVFGLLMLFQSWLKIPVLHDLQMESLLTMLAEPVQAFECFSTSICVASLYLGLFVCPLAIQLLQPINGCRIWSNKHLLFLISALSIGAIHLGWMPLAGNVLTAEGLGPVTLRDTYILKLPHAAFFPSWVWMLMTITSIIGATILLACLALAIKDLLSNFRCSVKPFVEDDRRIACVFFLSAAAIYFLPVALLEFYDRYFIPLIPLVCAGIAPFTRQQPISTKGGLVAVAVALLLVSLWILSVPGTRDYLAWNRTRWMVLRDLVTQRRIPPTEIDGGYEFNGWHLYNDNYRSVPSKSWWWVTTVRFTLM